METQFSQDPHLEPSDPQSGGLSQPPEALPEDWRVPAPHRTYPHSQEDKPTQCLALKTSALNSGRDGDLWGTDVTAKGRRYSLPPSPTQHGGSTLKFASVPDEEDSLTCSAHVQEGQGSLELSLGVEVLEGAFIFFTSTWLAECSWGPFLTPSIYRASTACPALGLPCGLALPNLPTLASAPPSGP